MHTATTLNFVSVPLPPFPPRSLCPLPGAASSGGSSPSTAGGRHRCSSGSSRGPGAEAAVGTGGGRVGFAGSGGGYCCCGGRRRRRRRGGRRRTRAGRTGLRGGRRQRLFQHGGDSSGGGIEPGAAGSRAPLNTRARPLGGREAARTHAGKRALLAARFLSSPDAAARSGARVGRPAAASQGVLRPSRAKPPPPRAPGGPEGETGRGAAGRGRVGKKSRIRSHLACWLAGWLAFARALLCPASLRESESNERRRPAAPTGRRGAKRAPIGRPTVELALAGREKGKGGRGGGEEEGERKEVKSLER